MVLEADAIRAQVERLLHSKTFEGSEVHRRLLLFLTEKSVAGEAGRLKEYTVALDALAFGFFRDPQVNQWENMASSKRYEAMRKTLHNPEAMPWYTFTGTGEATAAFLVGKLLATRRREILITRSNMLSWQEISDSNLVFVGPPKFNAQLQGIPIAQEIVIEPRGIRILKPRPGEPSFLEDEFGLGPQFEGVTHALISHTPGFPAAANS